VVSLEARAEEAGLELKERSSKFCADRYQTATFETQAHCKEAKIDE
jgi:hypothetical protein